MAPFLAIRALMAGCILGNLLIGYIGDFHDGNIPIVLTCIISTAVYIGIAVNYSDGWFRVILFLCVFVSCMNRMGANLDSNFNKHVCRGCNQYLEEKINRAVSARGLTFDDNSDPITSILRLNKPRRNLRLLMAVIRHLVIIFRTYCIPHTYLFLQ